MIIYNIRYKLTDRREENCKVYINKEIAFAKVYD